MCLSIKVNFVHHHWHKTKAKLKCNCLERYKHFSVNLLNMYANIGQKDMDEN